LHAHFCCSSPSVVKVKVAIVAVDRGRTRPVAGCWLLIADVAVCSQQQPATSNSQLATPNWICRRLLTPLFFYCQLPVRIQGLSRLMTSFLGSSSWGYWKNNSYSCGFVDPKWSYSNARQTCLATCNPIEEWGKWKMFVGVGTELQLLLLLLLFQAELPLLRFPFPQQRKINAAREVIALLIAHE